MNRKYDWSFAASSAALQPVAAAVVVALDARVVAGRDELGVEALGARSTSVANFRSPLQCTHGIGVRPAAYSRTKFETTVLVELPLEVDDVVGDAEAGGDAPGVVQIVDRAAGAEARRRRSPLIVSCIDRPMTSCPACASSAAATDESTPPDMATTMRMTRTARIARRCYRARRRVSRRAPTRVRLRSFSTTVGQLRDRR